MKRIFSTLIISLLFQLVYGQLSFTTFYTKDDKETKDQEEAYYYRELSLMDDSKVRVMEKFIHTNKTKLLGIFPSFKDKRFIGQKLEGFENGKIKTKELYSLDGVLIDTAYYYYPNGKLKLAFEYPYKEEKEKKRLRIH